MSKLIDFLFGQSQEGDEPVLDSKTFGSDMIHLFEEADKEEGDKLSVNKQPLAKALASLGIANAGGDLELDPRGFSLVCGDSNEYRNYLQILSDPDSLAKLAGLGWVHSAQGDVAQHNEPTEFRIRFLEISVAGEDDEGKEPKTVPTKDQTNKALNAVLTKGREFATTPVAIDDPSGDVDREQPDSKTSEEDGKREGLGKEKDGTDPEGKTKGAEKGKKPEAVSKSPGKVSYKKESLEEGKCECGCADAYVRGGVWKCSKCDKPRTDKNDKLRQHQEEGLTEGAHSADESHRESAPEWASPGVKLRWKTAGAGKPDQVTGEPPSDRLGTPYSPDQTAGFKSSVHSAQCQCWPCRKKRDQAHQASVRFEPPLGEGAHKAGCQCGFCKNKGNIGSFKKGKKEEKPAELKDQEKPDEKPDETTESAQALAARLLEGPDESVDTEKLERGKVEPTHMSGGKYGKNVDPKGKTGGKFKFPTNYQVGHAMK